MVIHLMQQGRHASLLFRVNAAEACIHRVMINEISGTLKMNWPIKPYRRKPQAVVMIYDQGEDNQGLTADTAA
jgi:hypothetical protein